MTPRERYLQTLTFGCPDRIPLQPGAPRANLTRAVWYQQGLPEGVDFQTALFETLGLTPDPPPAVSLDVDFAMIPRFEEKVLAHEAGHYIVQDWHGRDRRDLRPIRSHLSPLGQGLRHPQMAPLPGGNARGLGADAGAL